VGVEPGGRRPSVWRPAAAGVLPGTVEGLPPIAVLSSGICWTRMGMWMELSEIASCHVLLLVVQVLGPKSRLVAGDDGAMGIVFLVEGITVSLNLQG